MWIGQANASTALAGDAIGERPQCFVNDVLNERFLRLFLGVDGILNFVLDIHHALFEFALHVEDHGLGDGSNRLHFGIESDVLLWRPRTARSPIAEGHLVSVFWVNRATAKHAVPDFSGRRREPPADHPLLR